MRHYVPKLNKNMKLAVLNAGFSISAASIRYNYLFIRIFL